MPKITEITLQTKNKNRCNLFLDGEFFVSLSIETVVKNRLKKGQEVDRIELADIILENEKAEALTKAISYVSKALKTKKGLFGRYCMALC